tara:strand:+ start:80 stop:529 length:450 start_codon:yes stop_codon:yes gene_type:complete
MSNKSDKSIDSKPIKELTKILDELNLSEISYTNGNFSVSVAKGSRIENARSSADQISSTSNKEQETSDFKNDPRAIKSPMVGTVYLQPEPGASQFVSIGDQIKSGQTLLIIEAMKTMNPIESTLQGKVIKVLVENEQAVEFGQPLILIG